MGDLTTELRETIRVLGHLQGSYVTRVLPTASILFITPMTKPGSDRTGSTKPGSDRTGLTKLEPDQTGLTKPGPDVIRLTKPGSDPERSDYYKFPLKYSSNREKKEDLRCVPLGCVFPFCQYYLGKKFCYSLTLLTISFNFLEGKIKKEARDMNRKNALLVKTNAHFQGPRTVAK